jgi:paraquat-inducible protein A
MTEVYLVGCFVSYSRIKVVSTVTIGVGGWSLVAAGLMLLVVLTQLDERTVWEMLHPQRPTDKVPVNGKALGCTMCDFLAPAPTAQHCLRCGARLHLRKPASIQRTAAFVLAGYLL